MELVGNSPNIHLLPRPTNKTHSSMSLMNLTVGSVTENKIFLSNVILMCQINTILQIAQLEKFMAIMGPVEELFSQLNSELTSTIDRVYPTVKVKQNI